MGMAAILVMWQRTVWTIFVPLTPGGYIWHLVTIGPAVSEEKSLKLLTDDGRRRTTEPAYTISSTGAFGSGELKSCIITTPSSRYDLNTVGKEVIPRVTHPLFNTYRYGFMTITASSESQWSPSWYIGLEIVIYLTIKTTINRVTQKGGLVKMQINKNQISLWNSIVA